MSSEKLPPIAILSRREKTMMGLNIQRSLKSVAGSASGPQKMSTRSRCLLHDAVRVYASHRNGFLPEDPIKSSSKKMDSVSPLVSLERNNYMNEGLSSYRKRYNSTKLPGSGVMIDSLHPLSKNIPENIILRRENTKLFMTIKSSRKSKKRPVSKFTQLHKLGLEQTFFAATINKINILDTVSQKVANNETDLSIQAVETLHGDQNSPRNVTHKFRVRGRNDKKCVDPVQFQPDGLPLEIHRASNMEAIPSIVKDNRNDKGSSAVKSHVSIEKPNGTKTIQFIDQLREVIPEVVKLKTETRDLYPIFDWTQQRKEDMMKKRFLDPMLKNFDTECSDSDSQRNDKNANEKGRQLHDDHNKFTPDRRHIELESKLMSQYKQRYRRVSHDVTGMRSPSFSPLLNPPPSAMEFNIFDLESLLELDRPLSPLIPIPFDTKPDNTTNGAPAVNGVACQPVSTAMLWSFKTKPTDAIPNAENANDLIEREPTGHRSDENDLPKQGGTENTYEDFKPKNKEHPIVVIEESPYEHPVEVIIKIISDEDIQNEPLNGSNNVHDVTKVSTKASLNQGGFSSTASFGTFLNVPRVDLSFEERIPGFCTNGSTLRHSVHDRPQSPFPGKQSAAKQLTQDRKLLSNKNIVFTSPVL